MNAKPNAVPSANVIPSNSAGSLIVSTAPPVVSPESHKYHMRIHSEEESGPPLSSVLHQGVLNGHLDSYNVHYHSSYRADIFVDTVSDAEHVHKCLKDFPTGYDITSALPMSTKSVHIVGLSEIPLDLYLRALGVLGEIL